MNRASDLEAQSAQCREELTAKQRAIADLVVKCHELQAELQQQTSGEAGHAQASQCSQVPTEGHNRVYESAAGRGTASVLDKVRDGLSAAGAVLGSQRSHSDLPALSSVRWLREDSHRVQMPRNNDHTTSAHVSTARAGDGATMVQDVRDMSNTVAEGIASTFLLLNPFAATSSSSTHPSAVLPYMLKRTAHTGSPHRISDRSDLAAQSIPSSSPKPEWEEMLFGSHSDCSLYGDEQCNVTVMP